jgi:hypothetical protein
MTLEFPKHNKLLYLMQVQLHTEHILKYLMPKVKTMTAPVASTGKAKGPHHSFLLFHLFRLENNIRESVSH